jgi:membrane protein
LLSVFPVAMVVVAYFHWAGSDTNVFADRIVDHLRLTGQTADLVRETFAGASSNVLAATLAAVIGFLFWGIGIAPIVQSLYARAWRIEAGSMSDQWLYALWFFALSCLLALFVAGAERLRAAGLLVLLPVWLIGSTAFWLWTPSFLLHRRIGLRALLPGALLATGVIGGAFLTAPLWIASTLNAQGTAFGSFGIAIGIVAYAFIMITMALVCAVFSPVWAQWRQAEKERTRPAAAPAGDIAPNLQPEGDA